MARPIRGSLPSIRRLYLWYVRARRPSLRNALLTLPSIVSFGQIEDHNLVSFLPLDTSNPDSVNTILSHLDNAMQYGEDEEPKMPKDMDEGDFAEEEE